MYSEYAALLSFKDLDEAIFGIHSAYFDMKLLELRKKHLDDPAAYWDAVRDFRRRKVQPFTLDPGKSQLSEEQLKDANKAFSQSEAYFTYQRGFVYWFDWRATFWAQSPEESVKELVEILVPSAALERLEQQVAVLEARIQQIEAFAAAAPAVRALGRTSVVPPPDPAMFGAHTVGAAAQPKPRSDDRIKLLNALMA